MAYPRRKRSTTKVPADARGGGADSPGDIAGHGWKAVAVRTWGAMRADQVSLLAGGLAFWTVLALVPTLVAVVSIYGLVADPVVVERQVEASLGAAPDEVRSLMSTLLDNARREGSNAGIAAAVSIVAGLFSASTAVKHLISATNAAYGAHETRSRVRLRLLALGCTAGAFSFVVLSFAVIAVVPTVLADSALGDASRIAVRVLRYPAIGVALLVALALLYRYGPDRPEPRWRWSSPGALVAVGLWLVGSLAFSAFVANYASFSESYGSLAGIVVVLLWLFLSAGVVLVGAELNNELERRAEGGAAGTEDGGTR